MKNERFCNGPPFLYSLTRFDGESNFLIFDKSIIIFALKLKWRLLFSFAEGLDLF